MPNMLIWLPKLNKHDIRCISVWLTDGQPFDFPAVTREQIAFTSFDKIKKKAKEYFDSCEKQGYFKREFGKSETTNTAKKLFGGSP